MFENGPCSGGINRIFVLQEQVKIYFISKPSIKMQLLPSVNDGRCYALSFDTLQAMFLRFQVLVQKCHSVTCHFFWQVSRSVLTIPSKTMELEGIFNAENMPLR